MKFKIVKTPIKLILALNKVVFSIILLSSINVFADCAQFIDSLSKFENVFLGKVFESKLIEYPPFGIHYFHADTSQHKYTVKFLEHKIKIYRTYKGSNSDTVVLYENWQGGGRNNLIIGFVYLIRCYTVNYTNDVSLFIPKQLNSKLMTNDCMHNKYLEADWYSDKAIYLDYFKLVELLKLDGDGQFNALFRNEDAKK